MRFVATGTLLLLSTQLSLSMLHRHRNGFHRSSRAAFSVLRQQINSLTDATASMQSWPTDARYVDYVGDWKYWYRENGHHTTTDDVIVSFVAVFRSTAFPSLKPHLPTTDKTYSVGTYVDLGCGIGSSLFVVAHALRPCKRIVGIEAQAQSAALAQRTAAGIADQIGSNSLPRIEVHHKDIRDLLPPSESKKLDDTIHTDLEGTCDLITANPPYAPLSLDRLPTDPQRAAARYELRGGIEEYAKVARRLLAPTGRFVFAFWHRDATRVEAACLAADLQIIGRLDVLMGNLGLLKPHLSVFEAKVRSNQGEGEKEIGVNSGREADYVVEELDITREALSGAYSEGYRAIRDALQMRSRPLKPSRKKPS